MPDPAPISLEHSLAESGRTPPPPDGPRRFFVVWSSQGRPPVARMGSFAQARVAAIRLANKHTDQDFFVLQSCWGKLGEPTENPVEPGGTGAGPETAGREPRS